jgi:hypothetical protein
MVAQSSTASMTWLYWALLTVFSWGIYGVILHKARGEMPMGTEAPHASLKAFLFVCIAYAVIGVVAAVVIKMRGSDWSLTSTGVTWSLVAGIAGAVGAFALVLSLGKASPIFAAAAAAAVMPIVFAGAPLVNTVTAMALHPPKDGLKSLPPLFIVGCLLAAGGAFLVAKYAPSNTGAETKPAAHTAPAEGGETK